MPYEATTNITKWNYQKNHVERELRGGEFISGMTTLIAAGPPTLADASSDTIDGLKQFAYPIGVLDSANLSQGRQLARIFEIGSKRSYFIPGRVMTGINLGRVLYYGPSLLKVLWTYYGDKLVDSFGDQDLKIKTDLKVASTNSESMAKILERPGYGDLFINLASDNIDYFTE